MPPPDPCTAPSPGVTSRSQPDQPTLTHSEAARRQAQLAGLQSALADLGVTSVIARHHRLVLRSPDAPRCLSGQTDPALHVLTPDGTRTVTTDGTSYRLNTGADFPVADPNATAGLIAVSRHPAVIPETAP